MIISLTCDVESQPKSKRPEKGRPPRNAQVVIFLYRVVLVEIHVKKLKKSVVYIVGPI